MSDSQIPSRDVTQSPISKSFKGILRVSNVKEITDKPDVFLNEDYYGEFVPSISNPTWEPEGIQGTESVLSGENERYLTSDDYTTLKLPVTDSLGNYMNFSLGTSSSLIGNISRNNVLEENLNFYDLTSSTIKVGLSEIKKEVDKELNGGALYIDNSLNSAAKIIIDNYYIHGEDDNNGIFTIPELKVQTIFEGGKNPKLFDTFLYNQESYRKSDTEKQCIVSVKNLKDYVISKVGDYIKYNTTEVPSGTIINQFCSLEKWYCSNNGEVDDYGAYQGYRPALGSREPGGNAQESAGMFSMGNTEQGVYSNKSYINYNLSSYSFNSVELPPEYKRGYVLADGTTYEMRLVPPYLNDVESADNSKKTLDLFLKLFFTLGYYYTAEVPAFMHVFKTKENAPILKDKTYIGREPQYNRYYIDYNDPAKQNYNYKKFILKSISKETLYGISLASIFAFKKFSEAYNNRRIFNKFISNNGNWDIENAIEWLKTQKIDEEFIFNTVFSDETLAQAEKDGETTVKNILYKYKNADNTRSVEIPLGKEVNKFSDYIEYYYIENDENDNAIVKHTYCPIYKTAEIYEIARLFAFKSSDWTNFNIKFSVPKLYSDSDDLVNEAHSISTNVNSNNVGLFVGSSGLSLADTVYVPSKNINFENDTTYENISSSYMYQQSNCVYSIGYQPHSHALAKGVLTLNPGEYSPANLKPKNFYPLSISIENAKNVLTNINELEDNIMAADFTWGDYVLSGANDGAQKWASESGALNYFLQERGAAQNVKLSNVYNNFNGIIAKELTVYTNDGKIDKNMHWYGRTSGPLWDPDTKNTNGSKKYTLNNDSGYFHPQSIKALPLIKL